MSARVPDLEIAALDDVDITLAPWRWPFAAARRGDIDRHFAELQGRRLGVWNGRVVLLHRYAIDGGVLRGACFETDYASLCAWRDWTFPDPSVFNFFAAAALCAADGAYLVGEMAADTAAAGLLYFPCGTPEPTDTDAAGKFDLTGNLRRELKEEVGLDLDALAVEPGWSLVRDRCYIGLLKRVTARESATELRDRILHNIAQDERPEFTAIRIVRSPADFDAAMPRFVTAYLEQVWRQ